MSSLKTPQTSPKQFVYFDNAIDMRSCTDDVIPILLPAGKHLVQNLNFFTCFLNNTPPKKQSLVLHWSSKRVPSEAFHMDAMELITFSISLDGTEHEKHYFIPCAILFTSLNIAIPYGCILRDSEQPKDNTLSAKDLAFERLCVYNELLEKYCEHNDINFHKIKTLRKKDNAYIFNLRSF